MTGKNWLAKTAGLAAFAFETKILGRRRPLLASVKLTNRCNLACPECPYYSRSDRLELTLSRETAVTACMELREMGVRLLVFEGGEPLLWEHDGFTLSDLVLELRKKFWSVAVTTNGTLPLNVPADVLWISVNGTRESHNASRCSSFDVVMQNIAESKHPRQYIHYTVRRDNLEDIIPAAEELSGLPNIRGITYQFFYPYTHQDLAAALTPTERAEAVTAIEEVRKTGTMKVLNSRSGLKRMVQNDWTCREWLLANVDPDGTVSQGCYVKGRGAVRCGHCGFTPVAELSRAWEMHPDSIAAGFKIFL